MIWDGFEYGNDQESHGYFLTAYEVTGKDQYGEVITPNVLSFIVTEGEFKS